MPKVRVARKAAAVILLAAAAFFGSATAASALDEPRVPENVGQYFTSGLVPRLANLFGAKAGAEVLFDNGAKVGPIHRVLVWTTAYLSGAKTADPTQITNSWVAPISAADGTVAGVATVWINPASSQPELADFSTGPALATALATAPPGTLLIRDDSRSAWFATDGKTLTPLISGSSGIATTTTPDAYQRQFTLTSPASAEFAPNGGLLIAVLVLGVVVVLLAVFVLLPDRRRRASVDAVPVNAVPARELPAVAVAVAVVGASTSEAVPEVSAAALAKPATAEPAGSNGVPAKPATAQDATAKPAGSNGVPARSENPKSALAKSAGLKSPARPAAANGAPVEPAGLKQGVVKSSAVKPGVTKSFAVKPGVAKSSAVKPRASKQQSAPDEPL